MTVFSKSLPCKTINLTDRYPTQTWHSVKLLAVSSSQACSFQFQHTIFGRPDNFLPLEKIRLMKLLLLHIYRGPTPSLLRKTSKIWSQALNLTPATSVVWPPGPFLKIFVVPVFDIIFFAVLYLNLFNLFSSLS